MSKIEYRPRGGQEGISVSTDELVEFAEFMGTKYIDTFIPIPNVPNETQKKRTKDCKHDGDAAYYETETGSHGWCCSHCGTVTQWG